MEGLRGPARSFESASPRMSFAFICKLFLVDFYSTAFFSFGGRLRDQADHGKCEFRTWPIDL